MKTRQISLFRIVLVSLVMMMLASSVSASVRHLQRDEVTGHVGSTREELLAKRELRKNEFSRKLEELHQQWEDHESGRRRLKEGFETQRLQRKIKAYQNKLEHLNQEIDDRVSNGCEYETIDGKVDKAIFTG
jgi:peptidoglycan hydrolase CwlO-like protein